MTGNNRDFSTADIMAAAAIVREVGCSQHTPSMLVAGLHTDDCRLAAIEHFAARVASAGWPGTHGLSCGRQVTTNSI